jgi:hypothetical protein
VSAFSERRAFNLAVCQEINARLEHGPMGDVECSECKEKQWVGGVFKCFFCLSYFCQDCAEKHFGKTREEYWNEKATAFADAMKGE